MKPRVLLVAAKTGYQTRSFDKAAERLGVDLRLATDRCHILDDPWGDRAIPVAFDDPAPAIGAIQGSFEGILAVGDRPARVAAQIAAKLGIPFHPAAAVTASANKFLTRERLREAGLPAPSYFTLPVDSDPGGGSCRAPYPCVLKPLGLSGSRGVIRANGEVEFQAAFRRIHKLLDEPEIRRFHDPQDRLIQVEDFIPGREFALEGVMTKGRLQTLALFDKPDPLDGPFFEETIYVTPSREPRDTQNAIADAAGRAAQALGLWHGPVHVEMRVNERGVWVLEMAARPIGGLCANALRFEGGESLESLLLRHAIGEDTRHLRREAAASGVMMIPIPGAGLYTGVVGVEAAKECAGITEVVITAKEGQLLLPLPEGASYLGFLFARSGDPEGVENALREAHGLLTFSISRSLPITR